MNEEIIGGIRNAMARGQSIEQAVRSLINAGYNLQEVKDAAGSFSEGGNFGSIDKKTVQPTSAKTDEKTKSPLPSLPKTGVIKPKSNTKIILLIILLLLIFIGLVGYLAYYLFLK